MYHVPVWGKLIVLGEHINTSYFYNTFPYWVIIQDHPIRNCDENEIGEEKENVKAGKS